MCLQLKQQSPERLPSRIIFMEQELFPCIIPTCVPVGQQGFFNVLCCALLVLSNTDRTAVLITNVSSCHVNH